MDFKKFAQIALKDIYLLFTDRTALLINIVTPLVLTFVIGAAFSGFGGNSSPIKNIPVIVVNHDTGAAFGTQQINFGQTVADTLKSVGDLLTVNVMDDEAAAQAQVRAGKAAVAILIPADFSQSLNPVNPLFGDQKIKLTLFRDIGNPISGDIVTLVVQQILTGFTNANIAVYAAGKVNTNPLFLMTQAGAITQEVGTKARTANQITITTTDVTAAAKQAAQPAQPFNLLSYFAPAMAVFFLNFGMAFGAMTIIEERDNWTLQRLLISPTSRMTVLAGKLGGTYVNGVLQLTVLILATSILAPLFGNKAPIWGTNIPALVLLVLIVVAASIGLGTIISAIAKTRQQAAVYASALLTIMGLIGGTFFATTGPTAKVTVNYWATSAFAALASTNDLTAIFPHIAVLLGMFVVFFGIGVFLFNRRLDV